MNYPAVGSTHTIPIRAPVTALTECRSSDRSAARIVQQLRVFSDCQVAG
jgi:hypothetical protein